MRGSVIEFVIRMMPAGGIATASFIAYLTESGTAKIPTIQAGAMKGWLRRNPRTTRPPLAALRPCWRWGFPGPPRRPYVGRLMMWGIRPGPLLFTQHANLVWGLIASMYVGNFLLLVMNIFLIPIFVVMLRIPYSIMMGLIVVFATVGAFSVNNSLFDVWMMLGFALLAYVMIKLKYPIVPLILALVLGKLSENSLRQALMLSGGSPVIFVSRPISALFMGAALLAYLTPGASLVLEAPACGRAGSRGSVPASAELRYCGRGEGIICRAARSAPRRQTTNQAIRQSRRPVVRRG